MSLISSGDMGSASRALPTIPLTGGAFHPDYKTLRRVQTGSQVGRQLEGVLAGEFGDT
jgi:hypothetical protein